MAACDARGDGEDEVTEEEDEEDAQAGARW